MSRIRSKDTKPELLVRKAVWAAGFRYRLHAAGLPGKPDLVFPGLGAVIFVNGCYWHGHACQKGRIPKANSGFWEQKFDANRRRDRRNRDRLSRAGWKVLVVHECTLATVAKRGATIGRVLDFLQRLRDNIPTGAPSVRARPINRTNPQ